CFPSANDTLPIGAMTTGVAGPLGQSAGGSMGGMLGSLTGMAGKFLPPEVARFLPAGQFLMSGGLSNLLSGNLGSLSGLTGLASQFLPPGAGDAMAAGQSVMGLMQGGSLEGAMNGLMGRFLPPELQGAWSAMQQMGGTQ